MHNGEALHFGLFSVLKYPHHLSQNMLNAASTKLNKYDGGDNQKKDNNAF